LENGEGWNCLCDCRRSGAGECSRRDLKTNGLGKLEKLFDTRAGSFISLFKTRATDLITLKAGRGNVILYPHSPRVAARDKSGVAGKRSGRRNKVGGS